MKKHYALRHAYPAGLYFHTLVVDGIPAATRRLVIE
ncbi:MAG: hypothetical protein JWP58_3678 [Hymenobacter sp.]|nr:hypothetical protein [Hymenobacter sp.]